MIILGIDPGYAIVGVGVIEYNGNKFKTLDYFAITTEAHTPFEKRLKIIYDGINDVIEKLQNIKCGFKQTSCPAQLAEALKNYKNKGE